MCDPSIPVAIFYNTDMTFPILCSHIMANMIDIITESTMFALTCYGQPTSNDMYVTIQMLWATKV